MPKKTKIKRKKSKTKNPVAGSSCCSTGGPLPPEYVNRFVGGSAPDPQKYTDEPRSVVSPCVYATRVTAANAVRYDGRVWSRPMLFTAAQIQSFRRVRRSQHQMRELVKGLIFQRPELEHAPREQLFAEVVNQLLHTNGAPPKIPKTWAETLRLLSHYMPVGGIAGALSLMRRHDADIENTFNHQFWAKHMPGRAAPNTPAERRLLVTDFVKRRWQATARSARTQVNTANDLKQNHPCSLYKAPVLRVHKQRGRRSGPLTDMDILGI